MLDRKQKITYALAHFRGPRIFSLTIFLIMALVLMACGLLGSNLETAESQSVIPTPTLEPTFTPLALPTDTPRLPPTVTTEPSPITVPGVGLAGRIFDKSTNQPIASAQVSIGTDTTVTNAEGRYSVTGLVPGQYILSVTHPDYDPGLSRIFTLTGGQDLLLDLPLYASETSPYPTDPMLTNPLDPNGAPTPEEAERLARLQGFAGEVVSIRETKLSGEFLVNYKIDDEIRAAVAKVNHEVWELIDEVGQKWWIIKVCGNLARRSPEQMSIPTPKPRVLPPMAEVVVDALQVRSCPSATCIEVGTIERGVQVEVLGCLADGGWCQVSLSDGQSGWCTGVSLRQLAVAEAVPVVVPGGGKIAFLSDRDREPGLADIYLMNPDGTEQVRITTGLKLSSALANSLANLEGNFAWSDVHQKFFYSNNRGEFYSVNADGSGEMLIREGVSYFDLSPDGEHMAFVPISPSPSPTPPEIAIMNIDGTNRIILTETTTRDSLSVAPDAWLLAPTWSPDGNQIAFYAGGSLAVMNPDGTDPIPLTPPFSTMEPFIWSPDGRHIAFKNPDHPGFDQVDVQDRSISKLIEQGLGPAWSPDGSKIAFYKSGPSGIPPNGPPPQPDISQGEWQIWVMNADGSGLTQLTFGGHNCCPIWVH